MSNNLPNTYRNITAKYYCWPRYSRVDQSARWLVRELSSYPWITVTQRPIFAPPYTL